MAGEYLDRVDEIVINGETNSFRFERFCAAAVSHAEGGVVVLGTSVSWDLGRDGVGVGRGSGIYVCTSLRDDVDHKALGDVERISDTTPDIKKLYFCSSQNLSEHRRDEMAAVLQSEVGDAFAIVVLGAIQLAELGRQESKALERHYGAEIRNILARISTAPDDQTELKGLRLALLSYGSDESISIRNAIYQSALLEILSDNEGRTAKALSNQISAELKLSQSIDEALVAPHLKKMVGEELVLEVGNVYRLAPAGEKKVEEQRVNAASSLIVGRNAIREELETAIGSRIIDEEFSRIWNVFEAKMSEYFQSRGDHIVSEIAAFLNDGDGGVDSPGFPSFSFIDDFAASVSAVSSHPDRQLELKTAIKDLFSDRSGSAANWLVRVCASFVAACTMGLEYKSAQAVKQLLRRVHIALDTDVVLSLLGEAESDHEAAKTIVRRWIGLGGNVLVGAPVLLEVAYHAHIAQRDYEQIRGLNLTDPRARFQLVENVFVRSFVKLVAGGQARIGQWPQYIDEYRGASEYDYSKVHAHLSSEYSIGRLPDRDSADAAIVQQVNEFLLAKMEESALRMDRKLRDKAMRDAELYVSLAAHMRRLRASEPGAAALLVSSARRLGDIDKHFGLSGEEKLVISVQAALFLMSMLPNVSLGLSSLRAFLFDEHRSKFSSDLERTLLRMIQGSEQFSMPFAKRASLMREVRARLVQRASHTEGRPSVAEIESAALKPDAQEGLVNVLAASLDAIAVDTRAESEVRELRRQVQELERRLEAQKRIKRKN